MLVSGGGESCFPLTFPLFLPVHQTVAFAASELFKSSVKTSKKQKKIFVPSQYLHLFSEKVIPVMRDSFHRSLMQLSAFHTSTSHQTSCRCSVRLLTCLGNSMLFICTEQSSFFRLVQNHHILDAPHLMECFLCWFCCCACHCENSRPSLPRFAIFHVEDSVSCFFENNGGHSWH